MTSRSLIGPAPVRATAEVATVDGSGAILTVTVTNGGSGYSDTVDACVDNGTGDFSANIANINGSTVTGTASGSLGTDNTDVTGDVSGALAAADSTVSGDFAAAIAASASTATGTFSVALAANTCNATADGAVVAGRRTINNVTRSIGLGDSGAGGASTANMKWHAYPNGQVYAAGAFNGSHTFTDYAEYFENLEHGVILLGSLVALNGRKVRPARDGDRVLGVVSATALVVAGDTPFTWAGRFLTGEFGEELYDEVPDPDWPEKVPDPDWPRSVPNPNHPVFDEVQVKNDKGEIVELRKLVASSPFIPNPEPAPLVPNPVPAPLVKIQRENPDYDPSIENVRRSDRPEEWTCVGLLGQIHVRVDETVAVGEYVKPFADGVGTKSDAETNVLCMEIRQPFDPKKGYAVAFCFVR